MLLLRSLPERRREGETERTRVLLRCAFGCLTFELTGVQKQSEAPLLNARVERFVGRFFHFR